VIPEHARARSATHQAFVKGKIKAAAFKNKAGKVPCFPTSRVGPRCSQ